MNVALKLLACLAMLTGASASRAAEPVMALVSSGFERLRVGLDLSGLVRTGNGAVVNMLIAKDEQDLADTSIEAMIARLPPELVRNAVRKGLAGAAAERELELKKFVIAPEVKVKTLERIRGTSEIGHAILLRFGTNMQLGNTIPIAITRDHRQLRVSLELELLKRVKIGFKRVSRRTVTIFSAPASIHLGAVAQDAWTAHNGKLLAETIAGAVQRAASMALAPPAGAEAFNDNSASVDVITELGAERFAGRLLTRSEGEVVILRPTGDLLVVPVLRVL